MVVDLAIRPPPRTASDDADDKLVAEFDWDATHAAIAAARARGQKVVLVPMSADLVHAGHLNILELAKSIGFVVLMLIDTSVLKLYKRSPIISWANRFKLCGALKPVDLVVPGSMVQPEGTTYSGPEAIFSVYKNSLERLRPDVLIHGDDWKTGTQNRARDHTVKFMAEIGGELIEPPYTKGISTSSIIKRCYLETLGEELSS